ncbi:hypothetical protein P8452_77032 [Trifolium repens]|nr:hypothetical protein P8452_77032 [Trifolium repens]
MNDALDMVDRYSASNVIFELDNQVIVRAVQQKRLIRKPWGNVVTRCINFLNRNPNSSIVSLNCITVSHFFTRCLPFRSLTPLLVALADTAFRGQPSPSNFTFLSLVVILAGAVGYVATDSGFTLTAYSWAFAYLVTITTEMVYIKHMVMNLGLNTWGFVLYNNVLSLMIAPVFWFLTGENFEVFTAIRSSTGSLFELNAFLAVSLSCVFGLLISFFGFAARKAVSATAFTVTGVVNKFLTVAINVTIWDKHASPAGLVCLLFTIVGGVLYQQSVTGNVLQQRDAVVVTKQTDVESSLVGDSDDESEGKEANSKDESAQTQLCIQKLGGTSTMQEEENQESS